MSFLKVIFFLISMRIVRILADCNEIFYDENAPPIFLEPFGTKHMIIDRVHTIPEGNYIEAFCESGYNFRIFNDLGDHEYINEYEPQKSKTIKISCDFNQLIYQSEFNIYHRIVDILICHNKDPKFYQSHVKYCNGTGFIYAQTIKNITIVYAELCYNTDDMKIDFWHYVAAKRSSVLENQLQNNPTNESRTLSESNLASFTNWPTINGPPFLLDKNNDAVLKELKINEFELNNLLLLPNYNGTIMSNAFDKIAWWTPLRTGNWRILNSLIEKQSFVENLNIYEGVSGEVTYPRDSHCNLGERKTLTDKFGRTSPLYIWKYINQTQDISETGFVIIGVNTPFVEHSSEQMCDDICDGLSWLEPMNRLRKMPVFGYIFCCRPEDVKKMLNGFPQE